MPVSQIEQGGAFAPLKFQLTNNSNGKLIDTGTYRLVCSLLWAQGFHQNKIQIEFVKKQYILHKKIPKHFQVLIVDPTHQIFDKASHQNKKSKNFSDFFLTPPPSQLFVFLLRKNQLQAEVRLRSHASYENLP